MYLLEICNRYMWITLIGSVIKTQNYDKWWFYVLFIWSKYLVTPALSLDIYCRSRLSIYVLNRQSSWFNFLKKKIEIRSRFTFSARIQLGLKIFMNTEACCIFYLTLEIIFLQARLTLLGGFQVKMLNTCRECELAANQTDLKTGSRQ